MKISFIASPKPAALEIVKQLVRSYGQNEAQDADYIVAVGGDGTVLKALHATLQMLGKPVFAMRLDDSVGALANRLALVDLPERLRSARPVALKPLRADAKDTAGVTKTIYGINEIVLVREQLQAAKVRVTLNGSEELARLTGDGLLISTPIGSSGYNRSVGGPILPLESSLLALMGLAVLPASSWANMVLNDATIFDIAVFDPERRPVRLETSLEEFRNVSEARVSCQHDTSMTLLLERNANHAILPLL